MEHRTAVGTFFHLARQAFPCALALWLSACATPGIPLPATVPAQSAARVDSPPEWRPGDRWVYEWTSGADTGTKSMEVIESTDINNVRYYIVRVGDVSHYYTVDLHWAGSARASTVEARMVPPEPWFAWPLEVGRQWSHRGTFEERDSRTQHNDTFQVVAAESVRVSAGQFHALQVVREMDQQLSDQYWYAPEVRWYVRWISRRGKIQFEERLREYHPAPRSPGPVPSTPPTK